VLQSDGGGSSRQRPQDVQDNLHDLWRGHLVCVWMIVFVKLLEMALYLVVYDAEIHWIGDEWMIEWGSNHAHWITRS